MVILFFHTMRAVPPSPLRFPFRFPLARQVFCPTAYCPVSLLARQPYPCPVAVGPSALHTARQPMAHQLTFPAFGLVAVGPSALHTARQPVPPVYVSCFWPGSRWPVSFSARHPVAHQLTIFPAFQPGSRWPVSFSARQS